MTGRLKCRVARRIRGGQRTLQRDRDGRGFQGFVSSHPGRWLAYVYLVTNLLDEVSLFFQFFFKRINLFLLEL
jgi:hypothetical protein